MLLMVEKGISCGICISIHQYVKANNTYMKDYEKNKESLLHDEKEFITSTKLWISIQKGS